MTFFHFSSPGSQLVQCNLNVAKLFTTFTFHLTTTPSYQLDRLRWITQLWIQIKFKLYKLCGSYTHRFSSWLVQFMKIMVFSLELPNVWKCVLVCDWENSGNESNQISFVWHVYSMLTVEKLLKWQYWVIESELRPQ